MTDITIYKKNNLYLFIDCDKDISREINELFSYFVKGYQYMPSYKYGSFDGKKRLYNANTQELPIGLLSDLVKFAQKNSYSIELKDKESILPINFDKEITEFMSKIHTYTNKSLEGVYEFQKIAVEKSLRKQRQLLLSPTSCMDENTEIEILVDYDTSILINNYFESICNQTIPIREHLLKIRLKFLEELVKYGIKTIKVNSPSGYVNITDTYRKSSEGKHLIFSDDTEIKCSNQHRMIFNSNWIEAHELKVNDYFIDCDKTIVGIIDLPEQDWVDFTVDAEHHSYYHNGIIHHNSGKSNIIYLIIRFLLEYTDYKILLLVPSTSLVEQMVSDFVSYVNDDFDIESHCHKIYAGKEKFTDKRIIVSTWQSLYTIGDEKSDIDIEEYFNHDVLLCDEVHTATGESIIKIVNNLQETCKVRLGFTGSIDSTKIMLMQLKSLFGQVHTTTTSRELQDSGVQSELSIEINLLKYSDESLQLFNKSKKTYPQEIKWLLTNKDRNDFIINTALNLENNTLILFHTISHGKALKLEMEKLATEHNKVILYIAGEIKTDKREEIRQQVELHDNLILLASYGTFKQGINAPNLHTVILAHPIESTIINIQSIGRGLRKIAGKKEKIKLVDIGDDLRYNKKSSNSKQNYTLKHLLSRIAIYDKEQFDYVTKKVVL